MSESWYIHNDLGHTLSTKSLVMLRQMEYQNQLYEASAVPHEKINWLIGNFIGSYELRHILIHHWTQEPGQYPE